MLHTLKRALKPNCEAPDPGTNLAALDVDCSSRLQLQQVLLSVYNVPTLPAPFD